MIARKNWLQMQMQDADADGAESWAQAVSGIEIPSPAATAREVPPTRIPGGPGTGAARVNSQGCPTLKSLESLGGLAVARTARAPPSSQVARRRNAIKTNRRCSSSRQIFCPKQSTSEHRPAPTVSTSISYSNSDTQNDFLPRPTQSHWHRMSRIPLLRPNSSEASAPGSRSASS